jgi:hypothetical protein
VNIGIFLKIEVCEGESSYMQGRLLFEQIRYLSLHFLASADLREIRNPFLSRITHTADSVSLNGRQSGPKV